jgi:tetratricopeptide (TPR) repeat protein
MRNAALVLCLALLSWALLPSPARADRQKAQQFFETGTQRYSEGKYDAAIDSFQAGFREEPLPDFLYNIAMAYQRSKRPDEAIRHLEMYQMLVRDPKERDQARAQIEKIQKERNLQSDSSGAFNFSGGGSSEGKPIYKRAGFWVALVSGVVAVAAVTTAAVVLSRKADPVLRLEQVP